MKKNFNTLHEQTFRMKSLFNDERLYGNLVMEQDTPTEKENTNIDGEVEKTVKTTPKPTAEELGKQGYQDKLPEGEKVADYDVKEDNTGKKWYKIKDAVKQQRAKAIEDQKSIEEKYKKFKEEKLVADADGNEWKIVDKNHKMDEENYAYLDSPINPTTKESEKYYKPMEKGVLTPKKKRFNQCKKVLKDLYKDYKKLDVGSDESEFIKNIGSDDKKDRDAHRVKQLQYCIKTNGDKLKKFPEFKLIINAFTKEYPGGYVESETERDDKSNKTKEKSPKKYRLDSTTFLKQKMGSTREYRLYGVKGAEVAYEQDGKWIIDSRIKRNTIAKLKDITGLNTVKLNIINDKKAPRGVVIQISGSK